MDHDYIELRPPSQEQIDEFDAIISQFREHPETWNQSIWLYDPQRPISECTTPQTALVEASCGTAGCLAGHAAARAGVALFFEDGLMSNPWVIDHDGNIHKLPEWAAAHLGLPNQRHWHETHPFDSGAELADMEQWLDWLRLAHKLGVNVVEARRLYLQEKQLQFQREVMGHLSEALGVLADEDPDEPDEDYEDEGE